MVVRRVISEDLYPEVSVKTEPESMFIRGGRKVIIYYQERGRLTVPADPTLLISCDTGL